MYMQKVCYVIDSSITHERLQDAGDSLLLRILQNDFNLMNLIRGKRGDSSGFLFREM